MANTIENSMVPMCSTRISYDDGYIWYDLIPIVDAEYEAYLDELFFRCFNLVN